jgi:hypothetical protein
MKPFKSLFVLAIVCAPALAFAQGYYGPGSQGPGGPGYGFHHRMGRLAFGFGLGLGGMSDNGSAVTSCDNCDFKPLAFEGDIHLGGMINPRFALMFEGQINAQTIHSDGFNGDTTLTQAAAMIAGQFWVVPQLWLKGGIGFSHLQVDDTFFTEDLGGGLALMAAAGFEVFSARNFAIDITGRIIEGTYNGGDDHVTSGTIGVGFDWY